MVPVDSVGVSRDPTYSGTLREAVVFRVRGCHPLWPTFPDRSTKRCFVTPIWRALQPREGNPLGLGLSAFARRYLRNRFFFLFHQLLRCFSWLGWPLTPMYSVLVNSRIPGSTLVCQLPQAFRRLPRSSSPLDAKTSPMRP